MRTFGTLILGVILAACATLSSTAEQDGPSVRRVAQGAGHVRRPRPEAAGALC
jgi:hypothetical protein